MGQLIKIHGKEIVPIVHRGEPVLTFKMVDEVHDRAEGTAKRNFSSNRDRFVEGEDFLKIAVDEIRTGNPAAISSQARGEIIVLTESGYLMVVKSFTDDLAWDVQRALVRCYFRAREAQSAPQALPAVEETIEVKASEYWRMRAELAEIKLDNRTRKNFTETEKHTMRALKAQGIGNTEIGKRLNRSPDSVDSFFYSEKKKGRAR